MSRLISLLLVLFLLSCSTQNPNSSEKGKRESSPQGDPIPVGDLMPQAKDLKEKTAVPSTASKLSVLENKRNQDQDPAEEYYRQGIVAYIQGDDRKALQYFKKTVELRPDHLLAKTRIEKLQQETDDKKIKRAKEKYTQGLAHYMEGNFEKAKLLWEEALALDPYNPRIQKALDRVRAEFREKTIR